MALTEYWKLQVEIKEEILNVSSKKKRDERKITIKTGMEWFCSVTFETSWRVQYTLAPDCYVLPCVHICDLSLNCSHVKPPSLLIDWTDIIINLYTRRGHCVPGL